jgi:hypothetical protein
MSDCEDAGGEAYEVDYQEVEFHSEQGAVLRVKYTNGKPSSLLLVGTPAGTALRPAIKVTVAQARALSEL